MWWALAAGAGLGGDATAIGASANVVVLGIAERTGQPISFWQFTRYGLIISAATIAVSALYLWLRYFALAGTRHCLTRTSSPRAPRVFPPEDARTLERGLQGPHQPALPVFRYGGGQVDARDATPSSECPGHIPSVVCTVTRPVNCDMGRADSWDSAGPTMSPTPTEAP
jgi:hypothetical protein